LLRTFGIAVAVGAVIACAWGRLGFWPIAALVVLWFSFGGHWVEVGFLNWIRPRISEARIAQLACRLGVWFVAGVGLGLGMRITAVAFAGDPSDRWPAWWLGGVGFIGLELLVHLVAQIRGRDSFYNGRA
jgi:hypothetical protein